MPRTGIILAYDKSNIFDVRQTLESVLPYVDIVKIGLEAMTAETADGKTVATYIRELVIRGFHKDVMWDMKLHDISNTIGGAAKNIVELGSKMFTLHATASDAALEAAAKAAGDQSLALAVTVLTDLDEPQSHSRFGRTPSKAVLDFACNAQTLGINGLVCSPLELQYIKQHRTKSMTTVIPGIRPVWAAANDQKRVMTPAEAAEAGADYIVVGRPILQPPEGMTPAEAAKRIRAELDEAFASA